MADDGLTFEAWSPPHVGALTKKVNFTKLIESYVLNDRFNDLCDGVLTIPDDAVLPDGSLLRDKLLKVDEANHLNDVWSMIRILRGPTPIGHYLITRFEDNWSDQEPTSKVTLEGLEWLLDRATVPHFDWPADPTAEPDWIYGADSILTNTDFEASPITNELVSLIVDATAGTFKIGIDYPVGSGFVYTGNIAYNVTAANLAIELEALADLVDVAVSGLGTAANPFLIEVLDPAGVAMTWATDGALLTGTANITQEINGGHRSPEPWTESIHPITGLLHGSYQVFEISDEQAHSGTYSLKINANAPTYATDYPGAQQLFSVTPGRRFRASVWVYPTQTGPFALVIRTRDETMIASTSATLTAGSWQQLSITTVQIPTHISQIIFRVATLSSGDEPAWYVDDALLAPGMDTATLGKIMSDVRTAAVAQGVLTWLTPTWSTTLDSDGVAWDRNLKWNVNHNQTFLQLFEYARRWNYEFRLRWDVGDARFEWDMWNPSGGGQTRANIAVVGKAGVSNSGPIVRRPPDYTYLRVEGELGRWGDYASTTLDDVWGRLEKAQADRQGVESGELDQLAQRTVTRGQDKTSSRSVQVGDPAILPWTAYEPGDTVTLNLGPKDVRKQLRVAAIAVTMGKGEATPTYEVHFTSPVLTNEAAMAQGLRYLLREFRRPPAASAGREAFVNPVLPDEQEFIPTGRPEIIVGSFDTDPELRNICDYVLGGSHAAPADASVFFDGILTDLDMAEGDLVGRKGEIIVLNGTYYFNDRLTLDSDAFGKLTFAGQGHPRFVMNYNTAGGDGYTPLISIPGGGTAVNYPLTFENIQFDGTSKSNGIAFFQSTLTAKPMVYIYSCSFTNWVNTLYWIERGSPYMFHNNQVITCAFSNAAFHFDTGTTLTRVIHDNYFNNCTGNMVGGYAFSNHTLIHHNMCTGMTLNALGGVVYDGNVS